MDLIPDATIDVQPLVQLKDVVQGARNNTSKMLEKLEGFEKRLSELYNKTLPIQEVNLLS